ncbi:DUF1648 domain-containing protein [Peribacillus sp. Hz7]|uniref:DUF1648 domain-containing protein n=1 Tax=Peribacillus sp. Hz7 TaxID=3344873 RepID=UPI0035CA579F
MIGFSTYLGSLIFLIIIWGTLPEEVPAHYNALGEVGRWGSKWELLSGFSQWFLPVTIIGMGIPIVLGIIKQKRIQ